MKSSILALHLAITTPILAATLASCAAVSQENTPIWIDVRSKPEFDAGHLENATSIHFIDIAEQIQSVAPNKDKPILLYCTIGQRAGIALQTLENLGYTNVTNMGGLEDLRKQGFK